MLKRIVVYDCKIQQKLSLSILRICVYVLSDELCYKNKECYNAMCFLQTE